MALGLESHGTAVGGDQVEVARAEAERARTETRVLVRLAQVTSGSDDTEEVYEPAFDAARELFGAERAAILLFDDSDRTRFHAWRGLSDAYRAAVEGHSPWHRAQSDARPILIYDVTADETLAAFRPVFASEHIRAVGLVPLIARRQLLGKLMLYWDRPRAFSAHDEALALAIASQVAEALERARLHQMERRSFEAERLLAQAAAQRRAAIQLISDVGLTHLELDPLLREMLARVRRIFLCDTATLFVIDEARQRMVVRAADGIEHDAWEDMAMPVGTGVVGTIAAQGKPIAVEDVAAGGVISPVFRSRLHSMAGVPLIVRDKTLGVLHVGSIARRAFDATDLELLELVAARAVLALDRAHTYDALRAAEAKLRLALGAGRMGVWEWSIPTGRVSWSPTLESIHGLAPGTFAGTFEAYQHDVHPDDRDELVQHIRTSLETQREHHVEYRIVLPDGQVRWVAGHGNVVAVADGQPIAMIGVCMDITERKQTEQARAAATAELEQTLRDNELFAGILAHDLRNPLAAILTAVQVLVTQPANADERAQTLLRHVLATGGRMTRLVDQLLDFSRARVGGGVKLVPRPADLRGLCDHVVGELEGAHPDWKHRLEARGDCAGVWDPDRLLQVVSNLVANAGQHGAAGKDIAVTLDGTDRDSVTMSIHNHGSIPEALLPKLFIPFGNVLEGKAGGLGLGLFISKQIVVAHGGHIEVSSSDAHGTTLAVWLPRHTRRPEP